MPKRLRATSCPLCGHELGALVDDQWMPLPLDEYRERAEQELTKARGRADTCVVCGTPKPPRSGPALAAA
ncbi:MAG TPA: hypothetical protein VMN79_00210 [Casimicrobiaceae bacterium]|nr:hypothetical protein [Casimicrobiaceae bacterium]